MRRPSKRFLGERSVGDERKEGAGTVVVSPRCRHSTTGSRGAYIIGRLTVTFHVYKLSDAKLSLFSSSQPSQCFDDEGRF